MPETNLTIEQITHALDLKPLPVEGGLYRQTYVSTDMHAPGALPERYTWEEKPFSSAIYYLLTADADSFSALHRLPTDEIWHFYLGDPLEMTLLFPDGTSRQVILGPDILHGQQVQFCAPRGVWQGTRLLPGGQYALVGTTMAPAYTHADYEGGQRAELAAQYPHERERILRLTRV
jgi:predicted cupin superfamily sugar epimerase